MGLPRLTQGMFRSGWARPEQVNRPKLDVVLQLFFYSRIVYFVFIKFNFVLGDFVARAIQSGSVCIFV